MSKIDNPFFKKVGAFWIEGNNEPFYGIEDARKYQSNKGGDILNYRGEVIIHDSGPAIVEEQTAPMPSAPTQKKKSLWNLFGMLG